MIKNRKLIFDPLWGLVDITDFLPMIDTNHFQALGYKYQLGVTNILFPAATHTRKQHSLGAYQRTHQLTNEWLQIGFINKNEAKLLKAYALWHDIGHGPCSHVVEAVTCDLWGRDHDQNGAEIVSQYQSLIESLDLDFEALKQLFNHENPLYLAVHDKNLGTEKLDYLSRDAYYTLGENPGVNYLAKHTYFINGRLMVDEKAIENIKSLQEFYIRMYKNVYLRKNAAIAQRMIQRIVFVFLENEKISEKDFWALTDFGLFGRLESSQHDYVQQETQRFLTRKLPKTAVEIKVEEFADISQRKDKELSFIGVEEKILQKLLSSEWLTKPSKIMQLEQEIAKALNLPHYSILIVPADSLNRFEPKDVEIYFRGHKTGWLSDYFPNHFRAIREEGRSYATIRICTLAQYRKKLSDPKLAHEIKKYFVSLATNQEELPLRATAIA